MYSSLATTVGSTSLRDLLEPDERRVPDEVENGRVLAPRHGRSLVRRHGLGTKPSPTRAPCERSLTRGGEHEGVPRGKAQRPGAAVAGAGQCRKWRRWVKTIVAPASRTASTTSSSRFEPPGWMIAPTPGLERGLRAVGEREERVRRERRALERVALAARLLDRQPHRVDPAHLAGADAERAQVLRRARSRSSSRACTPATRTAGRPRPSRPASRRPPPCPAGPRRPSRGPGRAGRRARACSRARRGRTGAARGRRGSACPASRAAPRARAASKPGAASTSTNCSAIRAPSSPGTGRLSATTPPYADSGSHASARSYASSIVPATAAPHGFACLTITHAGSVNSSSSSRAAERSLRLLNESSLPCSCSTRESRCRRACASA